MKKWVLIIIIAAVSFSTGAQELKYSTGNWDPDSLGNHRVLVEVEKNEEAVHVNIPWRRKDLDPAQKEVIIVSAKSGKRITS